MKTILIVIVFFTSTSAVVFNCKFKTVEWMAIGLNYQCQTQAFNIKSSQFVKTVSGSHALNHTHNDVTGIHIYNCAKLSYIPKGILTVFPNLIGIYLDGCGITSLNGTELNEYPQLQLFALEKSNLTYVSGDLFAQTPELKLVSFVENLINVTGKNLLSNLTKLSEVYFDHNVCINGNATTMEEIPKFIETLNNNCSTASEVFKSVSLILLLSCFAYFEKFNWIN